jgi:hypothetical protein
MRAAEQMRSVGRAETGRREARGSGEPRGVPGRPAETQFRRSLVDRVKREIAEGRYETERRIDGAVEKLLRRVESGLI